jgi:hypothetical protein
MKPSEVLVISGTGTLGRRMVDRLCAEGLEPRVMSRSGRPGTIEGELLTGEGIEAAPRAVPPTGRRAMARTSAGSPIDADFNLLGGSSP